MKYNESTINYIKLLSKALAPMENFGGLQYIQDKHTGAEVVRVLDTLGNSFYLDVTSYDLEHILLDVFATVMGTAPASLIEDKRRRRALTALLWEAI